MQDKTFNGIKLSIKLVLTLFVSKRPVEIFIYYYSNNFFFHFVGIVPVFCEQIFVGIDEKKQVGDTGQYEVLLLNICK